MEHLETKNEPLTEEVRNTPETPSARLTIAVRRYPLTTKKAVELLLNGTLRSNVCRYCSYVTPLLSELDQIMEIGGKGGLYKVTIRDMVATFHPFKVVDDPNFPNKICDKCLNQAAKSYLFSQQCEQSERALRNCFDDLYDKVEKLDPLERPSKRGRQKRNPNHNVLRTEHKLVVNYAEPILHLINTGTVSLHDQPEISELECKKCAQVLPNVESLANHEKMHPKTMWYNCRLCGKSFAKKFHYNRHLRSHKPLKFGPEAEDTFECKECGYKSDDYLLHIQHIEKHKFKMVMHHLVERKMDKLCAVCLDRGPQMSNMDQTICLHGGYPELTGQFSVYNILGGSVPEKNKKYKYQELLIAHQAKIMTLIKKTASTKSLKEEFSFPLIVSTEKFDCVDIERKLFNFDKPDFLTSTDKIIEIEDENIDQNRRANTDLSNFKMEDINPNMAYDFQFDDDNVENTPMITDNTSDDLKNSNEDVIVDTKHFMFSYPDYDEGLKSAYEDNTTLIQPHEKKIEMTCKICWIFKKPMCKKCKIETSEHNKEKLVNTVFEEEEESLKSCKYCWVFKNTNCEYCRMSNNNQEPLETPKKDTISDSINNQSEKENAIVKDTINKIIDDSFNNETQNDRKNSERQVEPVARKRKIIEDFDNVHVKKTKWECEICLTSNSTKRETCICCDYSVLKSNNNHLPKFNLGNNDSFINMIKKMKEANRNPLTESKDNNNEQPSITEMNESSVIPCQEIEVSHHTTHSNFGTENIPQQQPQDITVTDLPKIGFLNIAKEALMDFENYNSIVEEMDTATEVENYLVGQTTDLNKSHNFNQSPSEFSNLSQTPAPIVFPNVQFDMGTSSSKNNEPTRRFKKAIRKMTIG